MGGRSMYKVCPKKKLGRRMSLPARARVSLKKMSHANSAALFFKLKGGGASRRNLAKGSRPQKNVCHIRKK